MRPKIRFFHLLNNYTGSPQVLRTVIETCVEEGFDVVLYTSKGAGFLSDIKGVRYHSNFYVRSERRWITLFTFFISQLILAISLLRHWGEKSVFYTNTILPFSAVLMGRLMGKRVISHIHEYEVSPKILDRFLFWINRSFSSEVIVVSKFLSENPKLGDRGVVILPNSVNPRISESALPATWDHGSFQVLMLASLRPYKGIDDFVQISRCLPDVNFVLVLSDPASAVKEWERKQEAGGNLKVYAVQRDVVPFYQNSHLVLSLTHTDEWLETFGMTILEGFYFGLPGIVPILGGVAELIEDGYNGYRIDHSCQADIVSKIRNLASDRMAWEMLGAGAKQTSELYSISKFKEQIVKIVSNEG